MRGTEKEKYITRVFDGNNKGVRMALKKEKYITRVFVFRPCLFHIEGGLMFVFVFVNMCRNLGGATQGS